MSYGKLEPKDFNQERELEFAKDLLNKEFEFKTSQLKQEFDFKMFKLKLAYEMKLKEIIKKLAKS